MQQQDIDQARIQKASVEGIARLLPPGIVQAELTAAIRRIDEQLARAEQQLQAAGNAADVSMSEAPPASPSLGQREEVSPRSSSQTTQQDQLQEYRKLQADRLAQKKAKTTSCGDSVLVEGGSNLDFTFNTTGKLGLVWDNMQPGRIKEVKGQAKGLGLLVGDRACAIDGAEVPPQGAVSKTCCSFLLLFLAALSSLLRCGNCDIHLFCFPITCYTGLASASAFKAFKKNKMDARVNVKSYAHIYILYVYHLT